MKKITITLAAWTLLALTQAASAQQPANPPQEIPVAATPEMWFYQQQLARYDDPKTAVRRKAEFSAAQRQQRIAAMNWYGYSNSRPTANSTPWGSAYSPTWSSNSTRPYAWSGGTRTIIVPMMGSYLH